MMMRKILLACAILLLSCQSVIADDYDLAGLWHIGGTGFVEKSFVRISLELDGDMTLTTAGITAWKDHIPNGIRIPVPLTDKAPSEVVGLMLLLVIAGVMKIVRN